MFLINFYRIFICVFIGIASYFLFLRSLWITAVVVFLLRALWFFVEKQIKNLQISAWFKTHSTIFKELTGPYGVRLINKAQQDHSIRNSLSEVFVPNLKQLQKTVEQLEVMDTLFRSGIRPDGDTYQLHDLKLKYGKHRLEKESAKN